MDYNRSGVPLIEIVSEPDMRSAEEVIAYLEKLRMICQYLGVSDCKLQEGSMRADVNLSVREVGSDKLGVDACQEGVGFSGGVEVVLRRQFGRFFVQKVTGCHAETCQ